MRQCGDCTLCCRLLPVNELNKLANTSCDHQRHRKGCAIYKTAPFSCRMWSCRWLVEDDTANLRRPDRSRYVIDIMPEFITAQDNATGVQRRINVIQIWVDRNAPGFRTVHRTDRNLVAYMERRGRDGYAIQLRYDSTDSLIVFPPALADDGEWHERTGQSEGQHTIEQIAGIE